MHYLLGLLILAANPAAPIDSRHPEAAQIFHCGFEEASDTNYDGWPEGWSRRRSPQYPRYLPVRIMPGDAAEGSQSLRMELNGGAAAAFSPPIEVGTMFSYVLEGYLRTQNLRNDRAWFSIDFRDATGKVLETLSSEAVVDARKWKKLRLGPFTPSTAEVRTAVIGLHLEPLDVRRPDLKGVAEFDDLWLGRLPRMTLVTNCPHNIYTSGERIEIGCTLSGIFERDPLLRLELIDASGNESPTVIDRMDLPISQIPQRTLAEGGGVTVSTSWRPAIKRPGFYRVHVALEGTTGCILERSTTLAVMRSQEAPPHGEFAWSLPANRPLSLDTLAELLPQMGLNWVKLPVWVDEKQMHDLDEIVSFAERLGTRHIETVAVLCDPPPTARPQFGEAPSLQAADIFSAASNVWYSALEPIITRLSLQIRWWQLGVDDDTSFVGYPDVGRKIADVKSHLEQFGRELHLGFGWKMYCEMPTASGASPWDFVALSAEPAVTATELKQYVSRPAAEKGSTSRWVVLDPLSADQYDRATRTCDLVERMLAAKVSGAAGVSIPRPFDADHGLLNPDGTAGELLLPWRTTAQALAGARYLGALQLPGGSPNHVFVRDGQLTMVLWNQRTTREPLGLGSELTQTDLWGRSTSLSAGSGPPTATAGRLPSFVTGLSEPVTRWVMTTAFERTRLPSIFGSSQENALVVKNYFPQGVGGRMSLAAPDSWKVFPRNMEFKLAAGEQLRIPVGITLPFDAGTGPQKVRIDFEVNAEQPYTFSVYRELDIGLDDIRLEVSTRINSHGELEVEQNFTNTSPQPLNFKCLLFVPDRRRMVSQVLQVADQRDTKIYRLPNGRELLGKTLLIRAEEVGGPRTLNHRFVADE